MALDEPARIGAAQSGEGDSVDEKKVRTESELQVVRSCHVYIVGRNAGGSFLLE